VKEPLAHNEQRSGKMIANPDMDWMSILNPEITGKQSEKRKKTLSEIKKY